MKEVNWYLVVTIIAFIALFLKCLSEVDPDGFEKFTNFKVD